MKKVIKCVLIFCLLLIMVAFGCEGSSAEAPKSMTFSSVEDRHTWVVDHFLPEMEKNSWRYFNVPRSDGELLQEVVEKTGRRRGLELGSANGYSAIWIGLGMERNRGGLITVEIDKKKAALCSDNIKKSGLEQVITCIRGDALHVTPNLNGRFDFLFLDLGSMDVLPFVKAVESKLTEGFIIALHNLKFAGSYSNFFKYARLKGWFTKKIKPEGGYGLFLVYPKQLDIDDLLNS